jgi:hypothetical protein
VFGAFLTARGLEIKLKSLRALKARGADGGVSTTSNCICLSSFDCDDEAALADTVRFIRERAPASRLVLGPWGARDASVIKKVATAIQPDAVFDSFYDAANSILHDATA